MSVASRPHRRLSIQVPPDFAVSEGSAGVDKGAEEGAGPAAAPPAPETASRPRRRLAITTPTTPREELVSPGASVGDAAAPAATTSGKPRRRLSLTVPTGLAPPEEPAAAEARQSGKVDVPCYLRRDVAERLEEEFWRRQEQGEPCSRSEIIQAALEMALEDPQRLSAVLKRSVSGV